MSDQRTKIKETADRIGTPVGSNGNGHANGKVGSNGLHKKPEDLSEKALTLAADTWKATGEKVKKLAKEGEKLLAMKREDFEEIYQVMDTLIASHHPHLVDSEAEIALLWIMEPSFSGGEIVLGRTAKVTTPMNALVGLIAKKTHRPFNFTISLDVGAWERLTPDQREAVMDHYICRAFAEEKKLDDRGNTGWQYKLRQPPIREFPEVIQRHGIYLEILKEFVEAAKEAAIPTLFTSPNAPVESDIPRESDQR